jgi:hypothetical protein
MNLPSEVNFSSDFIVLFGTVILLGRYALVFLDRQVNKFFNNTDQDYDDFVTHEQCKSRMEQYHSNRIQEERAWRKEFSVLKLVTYRIGRKLNVEDDVLEKLIGDSADQQD